MSSCQASIYIKVGGSPTVIVGHRPLRTTQGERTQPGSLLLTQYCLYDIGEIFNMRYICEYDLYFTLSLLL